MTIAAQPTLRFKYFLASFAKTFDETAPAIARAFAYLSIPASMVYAGAIISMIPVALFGLISFLRGADPRRGLSAIAVFGAAWFCLFVVLDAANGTLPFDDASTAAKAFFVLIALPFVIIGIRASRVRPEIVLAITGISLFVAAGLILLPDLIGSDERPLRLFPGPSLQPIEFGFVVVLLGIALLSASLRSAQPDWALFAFALVALVPAAATGSRIVWACALAGYIAVATTWAITHRLWLTLGSAALAIVAGAIILLQTEFFSQRISGLLGDLTKMTRGDSSGDAVGRRFEELSIAWNAFLQRPLSGYGIQQLHNEYAAQLVSFGLPGLLFVLSFLVFFAVTATRTGDPVARMFGIAASVSLAIFMLASAVLSFPNRFGVLFVLLAFTVASSSNAANAVVRRAPAQTP